MYIAHRIVQPSYLKFIHPAVGFSLASVLGDLVIVIVKLLWDLLCPRASIVYLSPGYFILSIDIQLRHKRGVQSLFSLPEVAIGLNECLIHLCVVTKWACFSIVCCNHSAPYLFFLNNTTEKVYPYWGKLLLSQRVLTVGWNVSLVLSNKRNTGPYWTCQSRCLNKTDWAESTCTHHLYLKSINIISSLRSRALCQFAGILLNIAVQCYKTCYVCS